MPEEREACEVEAAAANILHECCLRIDESARPKDVKALVDTALRVGHVVKHRLNDYGIERSGLKREIVRITDEHSPRPERHVSFYELNPGNRNHSFHPDAQNAATHDQDAWGPALRLEKRCESREVRSRLDIEIHRGQQPRDEAMKPSRIQVEEEIPALPEVIEAEDTRRLVKQNGTAVDNGEGHAAGSAHTMQGGRTHSQRGLTYWTPKPLQYRVTEPKCIRHPVISYLACCQTPARQFLQVSRFRRAKHCNRLLHLDHNRA